MVKMVLIFILLPSLLWAGEIERVYTSGVVPSDNADRIETKENGNVILNIRDKATLEVYPNTTMDTKEKLRLLKGKVAIYTGENTPLEVLVENDHTLELCGKITLSVEKNVTVVCINKESYLKSGKLKLSANGENTECFEQSGDGWTSTKSDTDQQPFNYSYALKNKIDIDEFAGELPALEKRKKKKKDGPKKVDKSDAESGSGSGSVCLDSEGQGAGDIEGGQTEIEVEKGKANVTVRIEIGD